MNEKNKLIAGTIFFGLIATCALYTNSNARSSSTWVLVISLAFVVAGLYGIWKSRNENEIATNTSRTKTKWDLPVIIATREIMFPKGYYFRVSPLNDKKVITAERINEINLNTFPPSLVMDHQEVIFLKSELKDELKKFSDRNHIPVVDRYDIWENICKPFLDTEFTNEETEQTLRELAENGVSKRDTEIIRKRISRILWVNFLVWEWNYLGQFDYLAWSSFLTRKKYWWTMDIALRNYTKRTT